MAVKTTAIVLGMLGFALVGGGCSDAKPFARHVKAPQGQSVAQADPRNDPSAQPGAAQGGAPEGANGAGIDSPALHVSKAIAAACGLPPTKAAPNFEFDSTTIAQEDRTLLAGIARCMLEGALRGKKVALIGRADQRGENEYNMTLGESRADSVRRYLHDLGVEHDRIAATSRGELDATGTDEGCWARDRRVDIELAN